MADVLSSEQRSLCMAAVRSKDTSAELRVRRIAHGMGFRYALHKKELPGSPDLVFPSRKKVIFVHGCFWHGHGCARGMRIPASNRAYWVAKIERNRNRDKRSVSALRSAGWRTMVIWECELGDAVKLASKLNRFIAVSSEDTQ